ncbi:MAG: phosphoadenylyl-sulfate reductase [Chloroflexi bacterium]|nr:phosphoadenylyl-sulfate reductase [Chloroflexota bacterium]
MDQVRDSAGTGRVAVDAAPPERQNGSRGALDGLEVELLAGRFDGTEPQSVIRWALERFGRRVVICTSFQADGVVIVDMAWRLDPRVRVATIDTGRLPAETYELMDQVRERYGIPVEVFTPDARAVEQMVRQHGVNLFYRDLTKRRICCEVRKAAPLRRMLDGLDAWIVGLRRDQADTRSRIRKVEVDWVHGGILKVSPLADWTEEEVWGYIRAHDVPYNKLYDQGYRSIGCAPCTRTVAAGEDPRAGRWWWEKDAPKECGLHCAIEAGGARRARAGLSRFP